MCGWDLISTGCSDAQVHRSPDGRCFAKTASTPSTRVELEHERDRLMWLSTVPIAAPRVLDWSEREDGRTLVTTLVTSALDGVPASALAPVDARTATRRVVEFLDVLQGLVVGDCPFDRRLAVTIPAAQVNVAVGVVDPEDFDEVRRGHTTGDLLGLLLAGRHRAVAAEQADLAVCHGDFCLPNVLLDPDTLTVTGILDVGRLGVADRHLDIALLTRSLASTALNPGYGPEWAAWVCRRTGADPWRIEYYRLLDEFF